MSKSVLRRLRLMSWTIAVLVVIDSNDASLSSPNHGTLKLTRGGGEGGDGGTLSLKKVIQNIPLDAPPPPPLHFHAPGATIGANTVSCFLTLILWFCLMLSFCKISLYSLFISRQASILLVKFTPDLHYKLYL